MSSPAPGADQRAGATDVGVFSSPLLPPGAPLGFHLLAKPTGAICNLDCTYCFFLSKELLYPGSRFRMADELLERYLTQLIDAHRGAPEVMVAFQGGEPTMMGLEFFRRTVSLARSIADPRQQVTFTIQTNGVLVDQRWAEFFAEEGFLVGLSIDGPKDIHDAYRVDKRGLGSFDRVIEGLTHLRQADVAWNALTTVHAANEHRGREVYRFLRDDLGAQYCQFIPIIERTTTETLKIANAGWGDRAKDRPLYIQQGGAVTERSITKAGFGRFLIEIFEDWVRRDVGQVFVQMFDVALGAYYGEPSGLCIHSETCGLALALEHNGDVYSCDHFVEPAHLLGNITTSTLVELVTKPQQVAFGLAKRDTLPDYCKRCEVRFACHGGCPKDRFIKTPDGDPGLHYLCESYKEFFTHVRPVMEQMCALLDAGQAPAQVSVHITRDDALRGRNDPCPCGSARKWKQCHGTPPG